MCNKPCNDLLSIREAGGCNQRSALNVYNEIFSRSSCAALLRLSTVSVKRFPFLIKNIVHEMWGSVETCQTWSICSFSGLRDMPILFKYKGTKRYFFVDNMTSILYWNVSDPFDNLKSMLIILDIRDPRRMYMKRCSPWWDVNEVLKRSDYIISIRQHLLPSYSTKKILASRSLVLLVNVRNQLQISFTY